MKCDNCGKEEQWLEIIGSQFICKRCISKHKIMGLIFRTHIDTFRTILKKAKVKSYEEMMTLTREKIESLVDLKKHKIYLKTTNIVDID